MQQEIYCNKMNLDRKDILHCFLSRLGKLAWTRRECHKFVFLKRINEEWEWCVFAHPFHKKVLLMNNNYLIATDRPHHRYLSSENKSIHSSLQDKIIEIEKRHCMNARTARNKESKEKIGTDTMSSSKIGQVIPRSQDKLYKSMGENQINKNKSIKYQHMTGKKNALDDVGVGEPKDS